MRKRDQAGKTKVTVQLEKELVSSLGDAVRKLGLRRDAYLNRMLPAELPYLQSLPANSREGEGYLYEFRSRDLTKLGINLDTSLVQRINALCEKKRILRNSFFESYFQFLIPRLHEAANILEDPRSSPTFSDDLPPYQELVLIDEEVKQWGMSVEAVARVKKIPVEHAHQALLKCPPGKRRRIFSSNKIKQAEKELREMTCSAGTLSFDDLLA
jgi:hypothetical protein